MTRRFYRVSDASNFAVTRWVYDNDDPFAHVDDWQPGYLIVAPLPGGGLDFPSPPRQRPICTVKTFEPDGVTPAPSSPPTDFRIKGDYWIISDRLKCVFEAIAPSAFSFVEVEMRWPGWTDGRTAWLARIVIGYDTHDPADVPLEAHAFVRSHNQGLPFFDDSLRARIVSEGATGFRFREVSRF